MPKPRKMLAILSMAAVLLLCLYRGVQIYRALQPPVTTAAPTTEPKSQTLRYSLTFTREVEVGKKK